MDFHIRVDALLDYVGELLVILDKSFNARHPSGVSSPELPAKFRKTPKAPTIEFDKREWDKLRGDIPSRLYESSIVQLASHFEIFISELVSEVYFANTSLLAIDELQLTTRQILEIGSIEKIRQYLIEKATRNLISRSYPALVEAFQHTFHVGLHQSHAPLPQVEIHHFIEIRNLIVHNDGHVSPGYIERMAIYDPPYHGMLTGDYGRPDIDFVWLFDFAVRLFSFCAFIDAEISNKWITTASPDWK